MRTPLDTALIPKESLTKSAQEHMQELVDALKITNLLVTSNWLAAQARQKQQHDRTAKEPDYKLRQQVMLKKHITPGLSKKLGHKFDGPFYITKVGPNHTFNLRRQSNHKPIRPRVHANPLKPYYNPVLRRYGRIVQRQQPRQPIQQQEPLEPVTHNATQNATQDATQNIDTQVTNGEQDVQQPQNDDREQNYFVEKILESANYKGQKLYKVKWLGLKNSTWERKSSLPENLINDFHIKHNAQGRKRKRPLKYFSKTSTN